MIRTPPVDLAVRATPDPDQRSPDETRRMRPPLRLRIAFLAIAAAACAGGHSSTPGVPSASRTRGETDRTRSERARGDRGGADPAVADREDANRAEADRSKAGRAAAARGDRGDAGGDRGDAGGDRAAIEALFRSIEDGFAAHSLERVLAAYDPSRAELVTRTRASVQGSLAFADARVRHRVGALTARGDDGEVVVLRKVTFTEHGRGQVDARWETVALRRLAAGWRIVAEDERSYARSGRAELEIELQPDAGTMRGSSRVDVEVTAAGEDRLLLALNRGLAVTSLTDGSGERVAFERDADTIEIEGRLEAGDKRTLRIGFAGSLFNEAKEQGYSQVDIAPGGSFASWVTSWYPHVAGTGSKATGRITYDVPAGITVASSGRLTSSKTQAGRTRAVFAIDRPLDFSFAAAPYFHREETVDGVHLGIYLLRGGDAKARLYLREAARTLRIERGLYGAYPFDGYAVVEIPTAAAGTLGGSSEQGMNLFPVGVLPDGEFPLLLVAHEIGHSWWGNLVGSADGPILDEGLAQTSAVACLRERRGEPATRSFLERGVPGYAQSAAMYFGRMAGARDVALGAAPAGADAAAALHTLADTKGMFVYDMLRASIGNAAFFGGLRTIVGRHAGKRFRLADLRAAWEAASGKDLGRFFAQWFERTGAPELALASRVEPDGAGFVVVGDLTQLGEPYDLDIEIALGFAGRVERRTVSVSGATTPLRLRTAAKPAWVVLDPDYKTLRWTPELRNQRLLAEAVSLVSVGRPTEGCTKIDEYLANAPDSLEGHYRAGACAEDAGQLSTAEDQFRFVIDRHRSLGRDEPAVALAQLHLGYVLDRAARRRDALAAYREVLRLPDEDGAHAGARAGLAAPHVATAPSAGPGRDALGRFVGNYDDGAGLTVTISLDDAGAPRSSLRGQPAAPLVWLGGVRFRVTGVSGVTVEFVGAPEVSAVDLDFGGHILHVPRKKS